MTTLKQIREALHIDTASVRGGVFTVRRSFFYTNGVTSDSLVRHVLGKFPAARILDHGEVWKAFRGGAKTADQSHWFVKFTL